MGTGMRSQLSRKKNPFFLISRHFKQISSSRALVVVSSVRNICVQLQFSAIEAYLQSGFISSCCSMHAICYPWKMRGTGTDSAVEIKVIQRVQPFHYLTNEKMSLKRENKMYCLIVLLCWTERTSLCVSLSRTKLRRCCVI